MVLLNESIEPIQTESNHGSHLCESVTPLISQLNQLRRITQLHTIYSTYPQNNFVIISGFYLTNYYLMFTLVLKKLLGSVLGEFVLFYQSVNL